MSNYGEFTGNPELSRSYKYGVHWSEKKGFKLIKGKQKYNHFFGGETWELPVCCNCKENFHQIITLDLEDPRLVEITKMKEKTFPLISCLNCSILWEEQVFKYDFENRKIEIMQYNNDIQWIQDESLRLPVPLPKVEFHLEELDECENPIDEEMYYENIEKIGREYIGRVLGAPLYLQNPIDYECPYCKNKMKYIATISSILEESDILPDFDFDFGETTLYFMYCEQCSVVKTVSQSD